MTTRAAVSAEAENLVTVTIKINGKGEVEVDHEPFMIFKSRHQQVLWRTSPPNVKFNVEFQEDSPFVYTQFSDLNPYSGLVRREVEGDPVRYYKYTVRIGGKTKDPGGIVNP